MFARNNQSARRNFGLITVACMAILFFVSINAHAVTYQTDVDVEFTFGPTLNLELSAADFFIDLLPGNYSDSNIVTINVNTNAAYGYTLYAAAGDGVTYANTNIINSSDSDPSTNKFTSLPTSASYSSMSSAGDDTWGYSYSTNNGSTWVNYSGLPYCTPVSGDCTQGASLITTTNAADSKSIKFKVAAKASITKPAGTYRNVINFYAVTAPNPN